MDKAGRIDWNDLNALRALAATGSTARAGRGLGLSHQTIARRLRRLETGMGCMLVDRGGTRWVLTPLGSQIAECAGEMARIVAGTLTLARPDTAGFKGRVTIAAPRWAVALAVLPALAALQPRHPELEFDLLAESSPADLALIAARGMPPGPAARRIASLGAGLYGTPAAVARMNAALASGSSPRPDAFAHARPHLVTLDTGGGSNVTHVGDLDTLVEAVRLGIGVAVLPDAVGRSLPGIVACTAIALPQGALALWCVSDQCSPRAAILRMVEREIFRACRPLSQRAT